MIKIAYDAKRAFQNFTGLGNYSRTLIASLATYAPENAYHLFAPKPNNSPRIQQWLAALPPSVTTHFPTGFQRKIHPVWRSYFIKNDVKRADIQIFHGLSHELPLNLPRGVKKVVTMHDLIHERYPDFYPYLDRKIYSLKFQQAARDADIVVAISEQTKRDLVDFYHINPDKIQVIYQSCDPQFSNPKIYSNEEKQSVRTKYNLPPQFLLYVGTVNERKNLLGLVKALQIIDNQNIKLVSIGDGGAYFQQVKDFVLKNKLENRIVFLPKIDFKDLPALYQMADVFVLPSFFEGFGIPIIEALWSGCPVITSQGSCFPEAGGHAALYINPNEPEDISKAILKVYNSTELRATMKADGLTYVQQFNARNIVNKWIKLYKSLI